MILLARGALVALMGSAGVAAPAGDPVDFNRDVRRVLSENCFKCHGPEKQKGGLRLDVKAAALKGGDDGKVIMPGKSAESRLLHLVAGREPDKIMPPKGERLTPEQVGRLRAWIDQGAPWPDDGKLARVRSEHWSLQPLRPSAALESIVSHQDSVISNQSARASTIRPPHTDSGSLNTDPSSRPLDAFILARLATNGLTLSPPADRATLIRRLSFDLMGLPPTPAAIDAFVADQSPRAFEELVERLLASPRYGERWGRHWLDVARYTESQGFEYDKLRDNAWHYRDYVIRSFNDDKPYDRFMKEQIAGDVLEPVTGDGIIGTSLLVCGPWDEAGNAQANATQKAITREEEMEDLISVIGQTFLGLTINCARCHSHKFDPIPQEEYYRIKSAFDGVKHGERSIASAAETKAREERIAALKREIASAQDVVSRLEVLASLSDAQRAGRDAALARMKQSQEALAAIKPPPVSYAGTRGQPAPTKLLRRGDVKSPADIVTPAALSAMVDLEPEFGLAADAPEALRRLKFAEWLADPRHPLPARVMANRVWHLHFGQGLVATPSDFGASGARPTHPELLDWLAAKLIESGWSVKALHRLMVNSATYRQGAGEVTRHQHSAIRKPSEGAAKATAPNPDSRRTDYFQRAAAIDADNTLLWRYPPHRLEAEAVRDAVLAVSGQLNLEAGGPSFRPFDALKFPANVYVPADKIGPEFNRRTVYRMNVNSGKEPLLDAFDCPDPSVKTPRRGVTTTPLQALGLMNNSFVQRHAGLLADRARKEADNDLPGAVQSAYRLALGRPATKEESTRATAVAKERGLSHVCWALLNSTEFIYIR